MDGKQEAHLMCLPDKVVDWSLPRASPGDGAPTQKNELKPWKKKEWCIPKVSGEFVARMEDVLDLYQSSGAPEV